jgi:rubrerythrin
VFAEIPDHGRRRDDSTGVSEPVQRRALVCGGCGYGIAVVRPPLRCPMCGAFDWRPHGSAGVRQPSAAERQR